MNRTEFLAARRTGIGGSDIGAILGVSPFKTSLDVYQAKVNPSPEEDETELTYWGHALEPVIIDRFARDHGIAVVRPAKIARHPKHDWMVANLDGIIPGDKPGVLEIKNVNQFAAKKWGEEGTDELPLTYVAQVAWYMAVMDFDYAIVAALFGGNDYREYRVERDAELEQTLITRGYAFWHYNVLKQTPPEPETRDELLKFLARSKDDGQSIPASYDTLQLYQELVEAKNNAKNALEYVRDLENRLKQEIGTALQIEYAGRVLATWKTQTSKQLDTKALKEQEPELYNRFLKTTESRVLRIK